MTMTSENHPAFRSGGEISPRPLMTPAELACTRQFLGFSWSQLADYLGLGNAADSVAAGVRRIQRMERGEEGIPEGIVNEIDELYEAATSLVNNLVIQYRKRVKKAETEEDGGDVILFTQRDDDPIPEDARGPRYPACWHRAVCARVAAQVPGLIIDYRPRP
jgi:hypothetical protein